MTATRKRTNAFTFACAIPFAFLPSATRAQSNAGDAIASWVALNAPPAWEHVAAPALRAALTGWKQDANGNWMRQIGQGSPHRVVACSIDRPSYVVSEIRPDGWLRVQTAGRAPAYALWAQQHEGQRALVITRSRNLPAVFATPSTHLLRGRTASPTPTTADDLYVDVGAKDSAAVAAMGIRMLDPVVRDWPAWSNGGGVSGMMAGARAGCAAIASAAAAGASSANAATGRTTYIIGTLGSFGNQGIGAALARIGHIDALTIVATGGRTASQRRTGRPAYVPRAAGVDSVTILTPAVRWPGSLTETISLAGADSLRAAVASAAGINAAAPWIALPSTPSPAALTDSLTSVAQTLTALANLYGVSGHEQTVRTAILSRLPAWARDRAKVDEAGNIIVAFGPDRDTAVIFGHMDETGYEVQSIAGDGTVSLRALGGMQQSLWEGQPALLHFDAPADGTTPQREPMRGVFVPREQADTKQPRTLTAWFGVDSAALIRSGVTKGTFITSPKNATRIGATRFTARSLDDRAGSTAMLLAIAQVDPARVQHKVIFIWTVEEETGLVGAAAVADRFGTSVHIAYSIDTFVSSDSPLESTRYAFAPLGGGAVLRALDSSSTLSPAEIDRILGVAHSAGIQLHENTTSGGTDGSTMLRYGALQTGVSWPGRYSHSPVEVLDLRDLKQLARLITAIAMH